MPLVRKMRWFCMLVVFVCWWYQLCRAHFNLFIGQQEVKKLLGLTSSELFYVRNGVVNTYAMNFDVPVQANNSQLEFSWQSVIRHALPYLWTVEYNNRAALKRPTFNISTQGYLPSKLTTFHVKLECTGDVSAEVRISLNLNVSAFSHRHNDTYLTFRRNKICLKRADTQPDSNEIPGGDKRMQTVGVTVTNLAINSSTNEQSNEVLVNNNDNSTSGRVSAENVPKKPSDNFLFYVSVACFCALVLVALVIIFNSSFVHTYLGITESRSRDSIQTSYTSAAYAPNPSVFVRLASSKNGNYATISSLHKYSTYVSPYATSYITPESVYIKGSHKDEHIYSNPETSSKISYYASFELVNNSNKTVLEDPRHKDINERLSQLNVNRNSIIIQRLVLEGAFGRVYRGLLRQPHNSDKLQSVLIKTVTDEASAQQISTFLSEGLMMFDLKHVNILSVIATNADLYYTPFLLYPLTSKGNLKKYLQKCRVRDGAGQYLSLHTQDIINMAIQVAVAGVFLHTNGFYHKDLATRNCVVDDDLRVKVTDSALSRDLFPNDYHCLGDNENRPIKWLAIESLIQGQYSGASDVWSYGVLLWELMSLAQPPYEDIDPFEMDLYLKDGYRLAQPINCPDDVFSMMTCCWQTNPEARPTFVQLLACLQDFQTTLTRYI